MNYNRIKEAIILSAGEGKRLGLSERVPKALVKINNKTLIDYQIEWLRKNGIERIILTVNKKQFDAAKKELGNKVEYSVEEERVGTAGGVKNVLLNGMVSDDEFLVINIDDLTDIDLKKLAENGTNSISIARMKSPFGVVYINNKFVEKFEEKPLLDIWVNCGVYLLNKEIIDKLPDNGDFEKDVFPNIKLKHYKHYGNWRTFNTQKDIEEAEKGNNRKKILITGGAGFIGTNIAEHFLHKGNEIIVYDNLSRPGGGAEKNIKYLIDKYKENPNFKFIKGDVKDFQLLSKAIKDIDIVFHVAAQTAMTISIENPIDDFETNGRGTFNVLEAARKSGCNPIIIYTSTNKVYGDLTKKNVSLIEKEKRWDFEDEKYKEGVDENYPLDFEGPYGCSKGIGDAYCMDYAKTFGMRTVVFRMSGIFGPSQYPTEDQGWIGWFLKRAMESQPVTIYGDGKQVRDILFISDLLNAFEKSVENIDKTAGNVYNIGGTRKNSISILELLEFLKEKINISSSSLKVDKWRLADQKVYITNASKAKKDFGWEPLISKEEGIRKLYEWMKNIK